MVLWGYRLKKVDRIDHVDTGHHSGCLLYANLALVFVYRDRAYRSRMFAAARVLLWLGGGDTVENLLPEGAEVFERIAKTFHQIAADIIKTWFFHVFFFILISSLNITNDVSSTETTGTNV